MHVGCETLDICNKIGLFGCDCVGGVVVVVHAVVVVGC